jgi:DNA mismatch endonuclease (patch repair protein)
MGHVVDHLSAEGRSRVMAAIRSKDTKPELALGFGLRAAGATGTGFMPRSCPGSRTWHSPDGG